MGSLSEDELLELSDEELFRGGGCHVFAGELYHHLESKGFVLRRIAQGRHPRFRAYHVYVTKGDTAIDIDGIKSEAGMLEELVEFRRNNGYPLTEYAAFPCEPQTLFDVCGAIDEPGLHNCWYHRIGDHFVNECRRRARAVIAATPQKYKIEQ